MQWTYGRYWFLLQNTVPLSSYHKNLYIMISCDIIRYENSIRFLWHNAWPHNWGHSLTKLLPCEIIIKVKSGCWTLLEWWRWSSWVLIIGTVPLLNVTRQVSWTHKSSPSNMLLSHCPCEENSSTALDSPKGSRQRANLSDWLSGYPYLRDLPSWWLNQPLWKIWVKLGIFPT